MSRKSKRADKAAETLDRITPAFRPVQVEKTAPCQVGCANCGDIRGWIGLVAQRHKTGSSRDQAMAQAWQLIAEVNPFPATLGRICPHPCESDCNRAELDEPLAINAMERFLGDFGIRVELPLPRLRSEESEEWIGVVGAGPSGLSFAYQMARRGYRVTVYDAREKAGGMLRYGVPDYRLPQQVLDAEIQKIVDLGVELRLNTRVGTDISLEELRSRHASLYLGIGAQMGRGLPVPGGDGPSVWTGSDYLAKINQGEAVETGARVIVVGGGNSAIDAARCARRGGADVTILYRRSRDEMPAIAHEIEDAIEEGVELILLAAPVSVEREGDGRMTGVQVQRMRLGQPDSSGRRRPEPLAGSEFRLPADTVIAAISQVPVLDGLESLDHDGDWLVADSHGAIDKDTLVGGDAVSPGIAGEAIIQGRHAAESLHARLRGLDPDKASDPVSPPIEPEDILLASKKGCEAVHESRLQGEQRVAAGMGEVAKTITEQQFLAEVERCFSCGSCYGCEQCYMYCTSGCFTKIEEPTPGMYFSLNLDQCKECGKCVEVCPCGFLEISQPSA
ncbi:MAG: FAD-dependent oxidoreductase [Xanthomonadales bacterium]|nr:FAD-dependent oxidoreductase [Gammaproteobacteria bacterium]MBT8053208.1 FAD-dependent oxidoreductase [Gammaproteobacteria bacterium]NNK50248.1 FAD-dependent oxidoreductase [Xanthomonadales bacterium]